MTSHCGYVAIIGRPNVGKSTLLNYLIGQKVSITSSKPQTTRFQIIGVQTEGENQAIYIDTPGIHSDEKRAMNRYMNRLASAVIPDANVIVFIIEGDQLRAEDELILQKLANTQAPVILVINKIDLLKTKDQLLPFIDSVKEKFNFKEIIPLSAKKGKNVQALVKKIMGLLPEGPHLFPDDQVTDRNERFQVAELIREKLIKMTGQEVPYATTVEIEEMKMEGKTLHIGAIIWVERDGQKVIIIGSKGERLKKIGTYARQDIEKLLNQKVFLRLWVKVKSDWTNDEKMLISLGYEQAFTDFAGKISRKDGNSMLSEIHSSRRNKK